MAKTLHFTFGGPATPARAEELDRWQREHLEQACSLPGVVAAHLYRPSGAQLPRTTVELPPTLVIHEYETDDLAADVDAMWAARVEGARRGAYEPGVSIPGPPDGVFAADWRYEAAHYNLISRTPRTPEWRLTGSTIFLVWVAAKAPALEEELLRWYVDGHLEEICGLPGVVSGQLLRPGRVQLPRASDRLPELLGFYECETDDLPGAIEAAWAAHRRGLETGVYEPGRSIPTPTDIVAVDPRYESAYYDLVASARGAGAG